MKFCPNCGNPLEGKEKCNCGYNTKTNEVDEKIYEEYKQIEKDNYKRQCDNMVFDNNPLGVNPNPNQVIFNKDNDNLKAKDIEELLMKK